MSSMAGGPPDNRIACAAIFILRRCRSGPVRAIRCLANQKQQQPMTEQDETQIGEFIAGKDSVVRRQAFCSLRYVKTICTVRARPVRIFPEA